jgi:NAD(P)-dependent dehydrogenase (short-subunit alcohol dehydrogenase family)
MPDRALAGVTALVTGASRGFGRGIATALSGAGARVVGVARDGAGAGARGGPGGVLTPEQVGRAVTGLVTGQEPDQDAYLVTAAGPRPLP